MTGHVQVPVKLPSFLEQLLVDLGRQEPFQVKPSSAYTAAIVAIVVHKLPS